MKILLAPDSFKGTFSSEQVIDMLADSIQRNWGGQELIKIPVADGGEGTTQALVIATGGEYRSARVHDALGREIDAEYGVIHDDTAVIEMAAVAGLVQIPPERRDPLALSSRGVGELMAHVLADGFRKILIGIGGSATNDGGMGMLSALGAKFTASGTILPGIGQDLETVDAVDLSGLLGALKETDIRVICDVTNPLLGEHGATYVYGPQKGAVGKTAERLEHGMERYAALMNRSLGIDMVSAQGAGAAGGVGAALGCILGAHMENGIELVLETVRFDELLRGVDLVVTGEGRLDGQSVKYGKVPVGIARHCKEKGVPVAIIVGSVGDGWENIFDVADCSIMSTVDAPMKLEEVLSDAQRLFRNAADKMFKFMKLL